MEATCNTRLWRLKLWSCTYRRHIDIISYCDTIWDYGWSHTVLYCVYCVVTTKYIYVSYSFYSLTPSWNIPLRCIGDVVYGFLLIVHFIFTVKQHYNNNYVRFYTNKTYLVTLNLPTSILVAMVVNFNRPEFKVNPRFWDVYYVCLSIVMNYCTIILFESYLSVHSGSGSGSVPRKYSDIQDGGRVSDKDLLSLSLRRL